MSGTSLSTSESNRRTAQPERRPEEQDASEILCGAYHPLCLCARLVLCMTGVLELDLTWLVVPVLCVDVLHVYGSFPVFQRHCGVVSVSLHVYLKSRHDHQRLPRLPPVLCFSGVCRVHRNTCRGRTGPIHQRHQRLPRLPKRPRSRPPGPCCLLRSQHMGLSCRRRRRRCRSRRIRRHHSSGVCRVHRKASLGRTGPTHQNEHGRLPLGAS
jgi:hypothetical protein